ncbi:MAG TPA: hypothetical protein VE287_06745, partial [Actinopolymorphaceae bacterium]|nr:hypothetical protein [Actinopolymorphaceae bacterium]
AQLQAAVRSVDPSGTKAMAVVDQPGLGGEPSILAVDSTRLSVVAGWRKEYGGDVDKVAAALRPAAPRPVTVASERLHITAAAFDPEGTAMQLRIRLRSLRTAKPVEAIVGPLPAKPQPFDVSIAGCRAGCRLIGVQVLGPKRHDSPSGVEASPAGVGYAAASDGAYVDLFRTSGSDKSTIPAALLADPTRWRPGLGPRDLGPIITTGKGRLRIAASQVSQDIPLDRSDWAFVADSPSPLPALVAGWRPEPTDEMRLVPLPGAAVPSQVVRTASLIPRHGKLGALVDLTYADRAVPFPLVGSGVSEVWLSDSAPASIVSDLQKAGLTPLRQESLSHRLTQLRAEGSAVGERFQAAVALVGLLLAAGAVVVDATRERPIRAAELAALRAQGVHGKVVKAVGYGGLGAVVGTATIIGLAAGLAGAAIDRTLYPGFVDGWSVLPTVAQRAYPVIAAAVLAAAVLGAAVVAAGAALIRQTEGRRT